MKAEMINIENKNRRIFAVLICILAATLIGALCIGRYSLSVKEVIQALFGAGELAETKQVVVMSVRLPRIMMAAVVGAGLACVGVCLQAMFANPLVSSHILGVSHSAGFGAALGILLSNNYLMIQGLSLLFGFVGMGTTYALSRGKDGKNSTISLVLSGVVVGAVVGAVVGFVVGSVVAFVVASVTGIVVGTVVDFVFGSVFFVEELELEPLPEELEVFFGVVALVVSETNSSDVSVSEGSVSTV